MNFQKKVIVTDSIKIPDNKLFDKLDNKELIISTGFKFHKERLSDKKVVDLIEKKLHDITNENIKFTVS